MYKILLILVILINCFSCKKEQEASQNGIYTLYLPTAFSPDNNYINDYYRVFGIGIKELHIKIYRYGFCIFEGNGSVDNIYWDGKKNNGKTWGDGTYLIELKVVDFYNISGEYKSSIHLFNKRSKDKEKYIFPDQIDNKYGVIYKTNEY